MNAGPNTTPIPALAEEFSLGELLVILWGGRWIILGTTLLALLLSTYYVWRATPIYQMDAMLQVEAKQASQGRPALEGKIEGLFQTSSQAQAQMEILQSNQVLGRVVQVHHLDLITTPKTNWFIGSALFRGKKDAPRLDVEIFNVPEAARGQVFTIEVTGNGTFTWKDPDDQILAQGNVEHAIQARWQGLPMELKVRNLVGKLGQRFILQRQQLLEVIEELRKDLTVSEKGKDTNIVVLTFKHPNPARGAEILNAILEQSNSENIERKTAEASRTLAFLQEELSQARDKLMKSEQLLDQYRASGRSGDLSEEARLMVQHSVDLEKQTLALSQKKEELLRTYTKGSDVVATLDQQLTNLQEEGKRLNAQGKTLPRAQQEVMRLTRDVQLNQEHYSSLMNLEAVNSQQLQMAKVGDIGNVRIVDHAIPSLRPVKPMKALVIGLGMVLGALTGIGLVMLRRSLHPVVVGDPQVLEAHFHLPVLATVPHSNNQAELTRKARKRKVGEEVPLLATAFPGDVAVESLRSLRTSLHFTMLDTPNRAIMFAGASPDIGKSFVSANFAVVLAQYGARVLLVDADMRKGKLHRHFGISGESDGLSDILVGSLGWRRALHHAQGLDLISTGTLPPNPSKLLYSQPFSLFLEGVCAAYDYVIIDAPPILAVTDAAIIGPHVGAVVLVVKDGQHPLGEIRAALQSLDIAGVWARGFVFNDLNPQNALLGHRNYAYHYTYQS